MISHVPDLSSGLADAFGRRITYARLSLTDRCNFRCLYCMPHEGMPFIPHEHIMSYEELLRLCRVMVSLGISRFKVTGGEPLCRKGAVGFIRDLARLPGVEEVSLTSNGALLEPHSAELATAGVRRITFSCDAFEQETFARLSRSDTSLQTVLRAMERAAENGMLVKVNTVPLKGYNDSQLVPLARYALERGYHIRFIELMPVGKARSLEGLPQDAIFAALAREFGPLLPVKRKTGNGPAVVYEVDGYPGLIGFIAALSGRFCDSCNRVRLTATGFLKTCLCHDAGVDCRTSARSGATDEQLASLIRNAVRDKPLGHTFSFAGQEQSPFFMNSVGG